MPHQPMQRVMYVKWRAKVKQCVQHKNSILHSAIMAVSHAVIYKKTFGDMTDFTDLCGDITK